MRRIMVEGEFIQPSLVGHSHVTEDEHLDVVRRKTAHMFSACAEVGGIVAGATREERRALARYGSSVGVAFQLIDDVLDFVSTEAKLGKPVANDIREGKLTLPLIYLMEEGNVERRPPTPDPQLSVCTAINATQTFLKGCATASGAVARW